MSVRAMTWALDQRVGSSGPRLLLLMLANGASYDGRRALSVQSMAHACEASPQQVQAWLIQLQAMGFITIEDVAVGETIQKVVQINPNGSLEPD